MLPKEELWHEKIKWVIYKTQGSDHGHNDKHHLITKRERDILWENVFMGRDKGFSTLNISPVFDEGPIYDMFPWFNWSIPEKLTERVSTLKTFLKSCLALVKDENASEKLSSLLE